MWRPAKNALGCASPSAVALGARAWQVEGLDANLFATDSDLRSTRIAWNLRDWPECAGAESALRRQPHLRAICLRCAPASGERQGVLGAPSRHTRRACVRRTPRAKITGAEPPVPADYLLAAGSKESRVLKQSSRRAKSL